VSFDFEVWQGLVEPGGEPPSGPAREGEQGGMITRRTRNASASTPTTRPEVDGGGDWPCLDACGVGPDVSSGATVAMAIGSEPITLWTVVVYTLLSATLAGVGPVSSGVLVATALYTMIRIDEGAATWTPVARSGL
jgi:hypothetical protein